MTKQLKKDLITIGKRIRYWRKYHYPSLPDAAKRAGVGKGLWSKLERGQSNFCYSTILKVSDTLFIPISDLLP